MEHGSMYYAIEQWRSIHHGVHKCKGNGDLIFDGHIWTIILFCITWLVSSTIGNDTLSFSAHFKNKAGTFKCVIKILWPGVYDMLITDKHKCSKQKCNHKVGPKKEV